MKKYNIIITCILLFALAVSSCTDGFEDLNKDPHAFDKLDPGVQLATAIVDLSGNREEVWRYDLGIASP